MVSDGQSLLMLVETLDGNLSLGMRQLNGVYTQCYNRRHRRPGHVFQGRYKSILVDKDSYLLELCRYVVLNPVRAKMVEYPEDYKWSSFRMTAGHVPRKPLLETDWLLAQFGNTLGQARSEYVRFVYAGIDIPSPWEFLKGQCILGGESYVQKIEPALKDKSLIEEVPRRERLAYRPGLEEILSVREIADKRKRNRAIVIAHREFGYTLTEIGNHIGLHYSTISTIIRVFQMRKPIKNISAIFPSPSHNITIIAILALPNILPTTILRLQIMTRFHQKFLALLFPNPSTFFVSLF